MNRLQALLAAALPVLVAGFATKPAAADPPARSAAVRELKWEDLVPEHERRNYRPGPPPPPPNQMVYVKSARKLDVRSLSDAQAVTGVLRTRGRITGIGAAAYTLDLQGIERIK